jgi:hypothetical protein
LQGHSPAGHSSSFSHFTLNPSIPAAAMTRAKTRPIQKFAQAAAKCSGEVRLDQTITITIITTALTNKGYTG